MFALVSSVYFDAFSQSDSTYEPDNLSTLHFLISPPAPSTQRSPIEYGGIGCKTNILAFPSAVACAFEASRSAFTASVSAIGCQ